VATAGAIVMTGATPVFVDVNAEYLMDPDRLADAVTPQTRAVIPVHLNGNPVDMRAIGEVAARRGLHVIEDCAQAVGATVDGKVTGSIGVAGAFSLFPLKNLGVAGDGGMLTTSSAELADRVRLLRHHGRATGTSARPGATTAGSTRSRPSWATRCSTRSSP